MSDYKYLGQAFKSFTPGKRFPAYSRVVINIDDDTAVSAGSRSGYTLTIDCPWGTQAMAENILHSLSGMAYQPFKAADAQLDPAVELGDALSIGGVYVGLYQQNTGLTAGAVSQICAPGEQEIDHEYPYKSPQTRKFARQTKALRADITLLAGQISLEVENRLSAVSALSARMDLSDTEIAAKVSQTGGSNRSFGWIMDVSSHKWYANNAVVFQISVDGAEIAGKVTAKSGLIGDCEIQNGVLKVKAANITDKLTAGQIDVDNLQALSSVIAGWSLSNTLIEKRVLDTSDETKTLYRVFLQATATPTAATNAIAVQGLDDAGTALEYKIRLTYGGKLYAKDAEIEGEITATSGTIGDCEIQNGVLKVKAANITDKLTAGQIDVDNLQALSSVIAGWSLSNTLIEKRVLDPSDETKTLYRVFLQATATPTAATNAIAVQGLNDAGTALENKIRLTYGGKLYAKDAEIEGKITATSGTIGGITLSNGQLIVDGQHIGEGAVGSFNIGAGAVGTTELGTGAVTFDILGYGAVGTSKIADAAVSTDKIADNAITGGKIADKAIELAKMIEAVATNITAGAAYAKACDQYSGTYPTYFRAYTMKADNYMYLPVSGQVWMGTSKLSLKKASVNGGTIKYVGWD